MATRSVGAGARSRPIEGSLDRPAVVLSYGTSRIGRVVAPSALTSSCVLVYVAYPALLTVTDTVPTPTFGIRKYPSAFVVADAPPVMVTVAPAIAAPADVVTLPVTAGRVTGAAPVSIITGLRGTRDRDAMIAAATEWAESHDALLVVVD